MNDLLDKFNEYKSIVNYHLFYELDDGTKLEFKFKQTDFPHLIGLHKLIDIPVIRQFNDTTNKTVSAKFLIHKIKQQRILTDVEVKNSCYFQSISERYMNFSKENLLAVSYTDAIINFNAALINSSLSSDYILFESVNDGYNHLCLAVDSSGNRYAESFFHNASNIYISGQKIVRIKNIQIFDSDGNLYLKYENG